MSNKVDQTLSRELTKEYFIDGKANALIKLIDICNKIFYVRLAKYDLDHHAIEDGIQDLAVDILKHANKYDASLGDDFISYSLKIINARAYKTLMSVMYPHIKSDNKCVLIATRLFSRGYTEEEAIQKHPSVTKSSCKIAKELKSRQYISIDDEEVKLQLVDEREFDQFDIIDQQKAFAKFIQCLNNLPEKDIRLIEDMYVHGKTLKQIGQEQGVSFQAIDYRFDTIFKKIRKQFIASGQADILTELRLELL